MTPDVRTRLAEALEADTRLTNSPPTPYDPHLLAAMLGDPRTWKQASHELPRLLSRDDLTPTEVAAICALVRVWLTNNPTAPHASFIVAPLLERRDLPPADAADAIQFAVEWLGRLLPGPYTADTGRVLCALLWRRDAPTVELQAILERWIVLHGLCSDAALVYRAAFTSKSTIPPGVIHRAVEWVEAAGEGARIDYVAHYLLTLRELPDPEWRRGAKVVFRWLARTPIAEDRHYPLVAVTRRLQLLTPEQREALAADIRRYLAASFTVPPHLVDRLGAVVKHIEEKRERLSLPHSSSFQGAIDEVEADLAAGRAPTTEALRHLLDMAEKRTARMPETVGYAVPCLLAGGARRGPPVADEVERWASALWTALADSPRPRDGLRSAIRRRLGEGWWPGTPRGIAATILHAAPTSSNGPQEGAPRATDAMKQAIAAVEAALSAGRPPTVESLRELLFRAEERLKRAPESAGYAGPALLAGAAHRRGELASDVERWAEALWTRLIDSPRAREGLRHACICRIADRWWPGPPQGITAMIINTRAPRPENHAHPHMRRPRAP